MDSSLRGQLLIAAPSLFDYFRRAVILVLEHNEEGAMGVVLNRPSETTVGEAVETLGDLAGGDDMVRLGGPVSPESVVALGDFEDLSEAASQVVGSLGLLDPDAPDPSLRRLRVYAGYAGWGPGQLDGELEEGAWIVASLDPEDPFRDGDLWADALQRKGGAYSLVATMPADPSLN
ncbi:MAG TPA: YqgE/AlgH family protein [Thermoleophilaceae bacterium]